MATTYLSRRVAKAPPQRSHLGSLGADALAILIGLSFMHTFRFGSQIPLPEVILALLAPFLVVLRSRKVLAGRAPRILLLLALWLIWQIATDVYRQSAFIDWVRGDALIIFFAIDIVALAALLGYNERRKALFIASLGIGILLGTRFEPGPNAQLDTWKFGYSLGVEFLVIVISCYFFKRRSYLIVGVLFSALVIANLAFYFRSPILSLLVTMALILPIFPERIGRVQLLGPPGSKSRILVLVCLAMAGAAAASFLVGTLAATGALGDAAQQKNQEQSQNNVGLLLGGRPEILVSSRAVFDSPILGYGSWAKNMKYVDMLTDLETKYGMAVDPEEVDANSEGVIPAHSHLMGSWVDAGLFGGVFWIYAFIVAIKAVVRATVERGTLTPIYVFMLMGFAWDILFSPFGASQRLYSAIALVVIRDLLDPPVVAVQPVFNQFRHSAERFKRPFPRRAF